MEKKKRLIHLCHILGRGSNRPFHTNINPCLQTLCCEKIVITSNDVQQCQHLYIGCRWFDPAILRGDQNTAGQGKCHMEVHPKEDTLVWWILGEVDRADENGNQKNFGKSPYQLGYPEKNCSWSWDHPKWLSINVHRWWPRWSRTFDTGTLNYYMVVDSADCPVRKQVLKTYKIQLTTKIQG